MALALRPGMRVSHTRTSGLKSGLRSLLAVALLAASLTACGDEEPAFKEGEIGTYSAGLSVGQVGGCSTAAVAGLSQQLLEEQNCIAPGSLVDFTGPGNISIGSAVLPYL